jgi:hypothetical protein
MPNVNPPAATAAMAAKLAKKKGRLSLKWRQRLERELRKKEKEENEAEAEEKEAWQTLDNFNVNSCFAYY